MPFQSRCSLRSEVRLCPARRSTPAEIGSVVHEPSRRVKKCNIAPRVVRVGMTVEENCTPSGRQDGKFSLLASYEKNSFLRMAEALPVMIWNRYAGYDSST